MKQISINDPMTRSGALIIAAGPAGGMGKSLSADLAAAHLMSSGISVSMIRMEAAVRRPEFVSDAFISVDDVATAETTVGGVSALFEQGWGIIETQIASGGVAILDAGANSHSAILRMASETGLSALVEARGGRTIVLMLVTRDADGIRQAVDLAADFCAQMPEADLILVLNERLGAFVVDQTPEGRAYSELLVPLLQKHKHVVMPFVGAKALNAFSGCSMLQVLSATDDELQAWSGHGLMVARSCQGRMANFFMRVGSQLDRVLPFPDDANSHP